MSDHNIFPEEVIYNILGHIKRCWDYTYPTGEALEEAFYRGLKSFYSDARSLGSANTIVDVAQGSKAFDIKGSKQLGHFHKISPTANIDDNWFVDVDTGKGPIKVKISKSVTTIVRRPQVDLENFTGDSAAILAAQIAEYTNFAFTTTARDGCNDLYSVVLQYGQDRGFKSVFLNIQKFSNVVVESTETHLKKNGVPNAYVGLDGSGDTAFLLYSFNRGSTNFYKTFLIESGYLFTWPEEDYDPTIYTKELLNDIGTVTVVPKQED